MRVPLLPLREQGHRALKYISKKDDVEDCLGFTGFEIRFIQLIRDCIRSGERLLNLVGLFQEILHFKVDVLRSCQLGVQANLTALDLRTSILSMSSLPYCFFSSLLACCMASTVAIVLRRFSVARAADSILNVCWTSCASWDSYMRFCFNVRNARCCTASYATRRMSQVN
jgi:hypothetical protein